MGLGRARFSGTLFYCAAARKRKMAKRKTAKKKRPIEDYDHRDKERLNNPPVGLVTPQTDPESGKKKKYQYDEHLDPQLVWAGKAEHTSFEVPTVSLHVHERIEPRTIIQAVRKKNGPYYQPGLFDSLEENPPLRDAIQFYKHAHNWSNRLIAGDSLLVMNSLLEKEGMGGQVQMIYIDPPYSISYNSNFQPFINKRTVQDGKDEDLTQEPEMIKAFRDTWELGIHSYLAYMRDRLFLAKELLHESGSLFIQISDVNLHHVREICDEVFGNQNFVCVINYKTKKMTLGNTRLLETIGDYIVYYAKDKDKIKFHPLYQNKDWRGDVHWSYVELTDGTRRTMTSQEKQNPSELPRDSKVFMPLDLRPSGYFSTGDFVYEFNGKKYYPAKGRCWKTNKEGMDNLSRANRLYETKTALTYVLYFDDYPVSRLTNYWDDTEGAYRAVYAVQTSEKVIQRCLLMATDPGDLVLDITCGSGTTAYIAEQWGRRWITCDTSRVALTLAKQRLMTALFHYYELAHPQEGVASGFKYKSVPHVTLGSIANNEPPPEETLYDQPNVDNSKARVTGPFTVEAVPAQAVKPLDEIEEQPASDESVVRSGETHRQDQWRDELLKTGIRGKGGQKIEFSRVDRWVERDG